MNPSIVVSSGRVLQIIYRDLVAIDADAHDAGFYLKRARACEAAYGSQSYHRDRYARIQGY